MRNAVMSAAVLLALAARPALAEGDAAAGEKVFARCKACHTIDEGGANRVGPNLHGVVGRAAGVVEGFRYSKAMQEAGANGLVWDEESLKEFFADPRGYIKGNRMAVPGLRNDEELENVIAYLQVND